MGATDPVCKGCDEELEGDQLWCDICGEDICGSCGMQCPVCGADVCVSCIAVCKVCDREVCDNCIKTIIGLPHCPECVDSKEVVQARIQREEDAKLERWKREVAAAGRRRM